MISPMREQIDAKQKNGWRISDYRAICAKSDGIAATMGSYWKRLSPFWQQFYYMLFGVMSGFGAGRSYLENRLFVQKPILRLSDTYLRSCAGYGLELGMHTKNQELPWRLSTPNPWQPCDANCPRESFQLENEELTIMGMGMFIGVHPRKAMFERLDVPYGAWMKLLDDWWNSISGEDMLRVREYIRYFGSTERDLEVDEHGAVSPKVKEDETKFAAEEAKIDIDLAVKNMANWTEEDFWLEMTKLMMMCKNDKDTKGIMKILEMKAKMMGLLKEDAKPVNVAILMLQEQAKSKLLSLGIAETKVIDG